MQDGNGRTTFGYDNARRLSSVVNSAAKRVTYGYDSADQRALLVEPGGNRFTFTWDAAGRIDHLIDTQGYRTSWTYDAADRVLTQRLGNGVRASYNYDDADRLLKLANITLGGTTLSSFAYVLDAVGNRTRVVEADGARVTWSYDSSYQLTRERRSGANAYDVTYSYDAAGNRRTMLSGGVTTTYTCDAANQLTSSLDNTGTTNYSYDAAGNKTSQVAPGGGRTTYAWDYEDRLTKIVLPSGTRNTFLYDADGKRIQKQDSTGTLNGIWDQASILEETDASNVTQVLYTQVPSFFGGVLSQIRAGVPRFFLSDGLGSTDRLTDSSANITDSYTYQAFGSVKASTGASVNPFRYVGQLGYYFDSDLAAYYVRARHYDPITGRFLSRDPLDITVIRSSAKTSALLSQALAGLLNLPSRLQFPPPVTNLYLYVENRPVQAVDPSGEASISDPYLCCSPVVPTWWCSGVCRCWNLPWLVVVALATPVLPQPPAFITLMETCCTAECQPPGATQPARLQNCMQVVLRAGVPAATCTCT
jgi:RHS repeat-associated protein